MGADLGLSDPVFQKRLKEAGIDPVKQPNEAGAMWIDNVWHGRAWSWEKIPWLIETWKKISGGRPFCLKGIQSVEDAKKAVEVGCDGIVVSNHAGRQVDGAIASLDALENIVAAVGDKTYIMYDSGIRVRHFLGSSLFVRGCFLSRKTTCRGKFPHVTCHHPSYSSEMSCYSNSHLQVEMLTPKFARVDLTCSRLLLWEQSLYGWEGFGFGD